MLMVAPIGRTNLTRRKGCQNSPLYQFVTDLEILLSTLFFSSKALMVTGRVAELEAVPNAVTIALPILAMNLEDEGEEKFKDDEKFED